VHAEEFRPGGEVLHGDSPDVARRGAEVSARLMDVPAYLVETAQRARGRLLAAGLPCVLGYSDFEAQNLRWHGREVWAAHDWDSLAWQPEAALAGAASGSFASDGPPTLAPIESSEAFRSGSCHRPSRWGRPPR
jgi:hypothetical protein